MARDRENGNEMALVALSLGEMTPSSVTVLVPTHHKSDEEILALCAFLRIETDAVFSVQREEVSKHVLDYKGHKITIAASDDIGVSKNRNHLLDLAPDGLCLCVDDDCVLEPGYEETVLSFFKEHNCDAALFNGLVPYEGNRKVHDKPTARVRHFKDVSYAGGPGLAYYGSKIRSLGIRYDERLGYPNEIYAGEDSLFLKGLSKSPLCFYRSSDVLFTVAIDKEDNSAYFKGFDDRFFLTKGAGGYLLYPRLSFLYLLHQVRRLHKQTGKPRGYIYKLLKQGRSMAKKL